MGYDALEGEFIFLEDAAGEFGEYYVCGVLRGGPDRAAGSAAICLSTTYPDGDDFLWVECELQAGAYRVAIGNGAGRQPPAIPPIPGEISWMCNAAGNLWAPTAPQAQALMAEGREAARRLAQVSSEHIDLDAIRVQYLQ